MRRGAPTSGGSFAGRVPFVFPIPRKNYSILSIIFPESFTRWITCQLGQTPVRAACWCARLPHPMTCRQQIGPDPADHRRNQADLQPGHPRLADPPPLPVLVLGGGAATKAGPAGSTTRAGTPTGPV